MFELSRLRKENNHAETQLSRENSDLITRMYSYLLASDLTVFEVETIRKDLTGMAIEAQMRERTFAEIVGDNYKQFCDDLIENGRKKTRLVKILEVVEVVLYATLALLSAEYLLSGLNPVIFLTPAFAASVTFGVICGTTVLWFLSRTIYHMPDEKRRTFQILSACCVLGIIAGFVLLYRYLPQMVIAAVDFVPAVCVMILVLLIVAILKRWRNS